MLTGRARMSRNLSRSLMSEALLSSTARQKAEVADPPGISSLRILC